MWPLQNYYAVDNEIWRVTDNATIAHLKELTENSYFVQVCAADCRAVALLCDVALAEMSAIRGKTIFLRHDTSDKIRSMLLRLGATIVKGHTTALWKAFREGRIQCMASNFGFGK